MGDRISQLFSRLRDYSIWEVGVEIAVLCLIVYAVLRFVRGTRAAGALKGMVVLFFGGWVVVRLLSQADLFPRLAIIYNTLLQYAAIALVVTFQPELRRALIRLGESPLLWGQPAAVRSVVDAVVEAAAFLSKSKFGAIMAIERSVGLRDAIETGRPLNADLSADLLSTIFWPNNPLHDMAAVIRGDKVVAAGVQFPLADAGDMPDEHLGTRHRAAVGLARATDALVVVVSEETGAISLADGTTFTRWLTPEALREHLLTRLVLADSAGDATADPGGDAGGGGNGVRPRRGARTPFKRRGTANA
ncbi:MAG: diadenylate cyclase CdaA [Planctomycetota bacterium]|nr:diadenylate cyclase CdaA [Planctomycetota bacterium]